MAVTGTENHRATPGMVLDWHTGPRRQYVIPMTGRREIEAAGGKKIIERPGHITLVEDTTGKGHITRTTGTEERVTLWLPLVDQSGRQFENRMSSRYRLRRWRATTLISLRIHATDQAPTVHVLRSTHLRT